MSALTLVRREFRASYLYFVPAGITVDNVTVTQTTWPDGVPTTNYGDYQFPDIEKVTEAQSTSDEVFKIPVRGASGGYFDETETHLFSKSWQIETAKTNALLKQLQYGLPSIPVVGTAQQPMTNRNHWIDGILLMEILGGDGSILERVQVWARMTLVSPGDTGPATSKWQVKFSHLPSGLDTMEIPPPPNQVS